jgi:hypothetical protein
LELNAGFKVDNAGAYESFVNDGLAFAKENDRIATQLLGARGLLAVRKENFAAAENHFIAAAAANAKHQEEVIAYSPFLAAHSEMLSVWAKERKWLEWFLLRAALRYAQEECLLSAKQLLGRVTAPDVAEAPLVHCAKFCVDALNHGDEGLYQATLKNYEEVFRADPALKRMVDSMGESYFGWARAVPKRGGNFLAEMMQSFLNPAPAPRVLAPSTMD